MTNYPVYQLLHEVHRPLQTCGLRYPAVYPSEHHTPTRVKRLAMPPHAVKTKEADTRYNHACMSSHGVCMIRYNYLFQD